MSTDPTPRRDSAAEHAAAEESRATPGGFCHAHWSWLCGRGQGRCEQEPSADGAAKQIDLIEMAIEDEETPLWVAETLTGLLGIIDAGRAERDDLRTKYHRAVAAEMNERAWAVAAIADLAEMRERAEQAEFDRNDARIDWTRISNELAEVKAERDRLAAAVETIRTLHDQAVRDAQEGNWDMELADSLRNRRYGYRDGLAAALAALDTTQDGGDRA